MTLRKLMASAGIFAALAVPAYAQDSEWNYEASVYLFAADTDIGVGDVEGTLSFSDALENLDFAGMAAFKATNNRWTLIGDLMYFNLGFENKVSLPNFSRLDTDQKNTVFTAAAYYRVYETPMMLLDLGAGFRYFSTDTELTLKGRTAGIPDQVASSDEDWTDPIIAAHARFKLSEQWSSMVALDYGSFVDDRTTYSATVTLDYAFDENWSGRIGYRYVSFENNDLDQDFNFDQSGLVLGVSYKF